ncbi:hypothetical protein [Rhodanobacter sp. Root627]|uniref:hypothetical protein n=1 Tax=Rhodanobacter sp. Root627 TaxID=1736572 RepID=UPI0012E390BA|nr:hypothetical protein [Rhodanobacter sp. Root627]
MKFWLRLAIVTAILLAAGCVRPPQGQIYSGTYYYMFKFSSFKPDGISENWCLSGNMDKAKASENGKPMPWGLTRVVIRGQLSPPGHYKCVYAFKRVLTVYKVVDVKILKK